MKLHEIVNLPITESKIELQYEGSCVNCRLFGYDATYMSNVVDNSQLLKPNYLQNTNIYDVSPKAVKQRLQKNTPVVVGYHKDLLWLYYDKVDKHYFYTADRALVIPTEYFEHRELDRGN